MSKYMRSRHVPLLLEEPKALDEGLVFFLDDVMEAGHILHEERERKGWSKEYLGNIVGLSAEQIASMENGDQPIPQGYAMLFSEIFGLSHHNFL